MASITVNYDENELKALVLKDLANKLGSIKLDEKNIKIEVKSKQNYKSEWEVAAYRASYTSYGN